MRWFLIALLAGAAGLALVLIGEHKLFARDDQLASGILSQFQMDGQMFSLAKRYPITPTEAAKGFTMGLLPKEARSLLRVDATLKHGDYRWDADGVPAGPVQVWVDLERQTISVFRDGYEIGTAIVVYGDNSMASPTGAFPILSKQKDYHSRSYNAPMPFSLFLTKDGVALHGSTISARRATHGCIGLPSAFAELLFEVASKGDIVQIVRSRTDHFGKLVAAPMPDLN